MDASGGIEEVIRKRYKESAEQLDRRILRGLSPYLQELLYIVSHLYTQFPQNYQTLLTNLLRLPEVVFISLNYDLLLNRVLAAVNPMLGMSWYLGYERSGSLIKLHGSVNWARR